MAGYETCGFDDRGVDKGDVGGNVVDGNDDVAMLMAMMMMAMLMAMMITTLVLSQIMDINERTRCHLQL